MLFWWWCLDSMGSWRPNKQQPQPLHWPAQPVPQTIKGQEQQVLSVSTVGTTTAGALGLSDTKETMRATLEIALLLLAGYFTSQTDGVSELLHVMILTTIRHTSAKTSIYVRIYNYNIYVLPFTHFLLSILYLAYTCYISSTSKTTHYTYVHKRTCTGCSVDSTL